MTSAYTINLNPNITTPVKTGYTFKSGDKGITFNLVVQEMDPTGTSAKIAFHRANGTSVEASLTGGGPNYSYTILGNEFAVPGVVVADVKFYQSTTQRVSTASFIFNVIGDTLDGLGGGTAGYSDELETLRATMEGYIEAFGELSPMKPRGAYSSSTQYYPGDCVTLNSASWLCIQPCKNVTPNDGAYWQKVVEVADPTKADKVNGATNGNFAGLDSNGNLTDSGEGPATISAIVNEYGSKNRMKLTLDIIKSLNTAGTWSGSDYTRNGATFSIITNGDGYVIEIILNGKATAASSLVLANGATNLISGQSYIINGCPQLSNAAYIRVIGLANDTGSGATFTAGASYTSDIYVPVTNVTITNASFKPMIRSADIDDATFVPYTMTNGELTAIKADKGFWEGSKTDVDFNNLPYGCVTVSGNLTNAPNSTNTAWVVFTSGGVNGSNTFKMQFAIGYNPSDVYMRRMWATWAAWVKLN